MFKGENALLGSHWLLSLHYSPPIFFLFFFKEPGHCCSHIHTHRTIYNVRHTQKVRLTHWWLENRKVTFFEEERRKFSSLLCFSCTFLNTAELKTDIIKCCFAGKECVALMWIHLHSLPSNPPALSSSPVTGNPIQCTLFTPILRWRSWPQNVLPIRRNTLMLQFGPSALKPNSIIV